jgi:hypothetical protein
MVGLRNGWSFEKKKLGKKKLNLTQEIYFFKIFLIKKKEKIY